MHVHDFLLGSDGMKLTAVGHEQACVIEFA